MFGTGTGPPAPRLPLKTEELLQRQLGLPENRPKCTYLDQPVPRHDGVALHILAMSVHQMRSLLMVEEETSPLQDLTHLPPAKRRQPPQTPTSTTCNSTGDVSSGTARPSIL